MKVNYTLPGLLPESSPKPTAELGERAAESFGTQLQRLRAPQHTDWRTLLRLDQPPAGAGDIGPPPTPSGIHMRDGAFQRAWWRAVLGKHVRLLESTSPEPVQRMLGLLLESQRLEDEVFARHFAEAME